MDRKERLNLVFDFISDYLLKEESAKNIETEVDGKMGRAHDIMMKMDEIDNIDSKIKSELKEKMKNLKSSHHADLKRDKENDIEEKTTESLEESFKNRTGVTLDSEGKITNVVVGPLKEHITT